jgi:predicted DNA-binding transcriptional regulator AlpA
MGYLFVSIKELCERYSIKRTTCYAWRKEQSFPSPITPSNCNPRWRISDIERWETTNADQVFVS